MKGIESSSKYCITIILIIFLIVSTLKVQIQNRADVTNPSTNSKIDLTNFPLTNTTNSPTILFSTPFGQVFDSPQAGVDPPLRPFYGSVFSSNLIAIDSAGDTCITGTINSTHLPIKNAFQSNLLGKTDAFVAKFTSSGFLIYSTYLGGARDDRGTAIAIDSNGNCYITGITTSSNFPLKNAFQNKLYTYGIAGFISKFNSVGKLIFSTYLESRDNFHVLPTSIAVDKSGNCYVTGDTDSNTFPTKNAYNSTFSGFYDAFLTKFNSNGDLVFSTYLGGSGIDGGFGIAVDLTGASYITGFTSSPNFPTKNAFNSTYSGGITDAFVAKFNYKGKLIFSTYLGGNSNHFYSIQGNPYTADQSSGNGIAVDNHGNVYIVGSTTSPVFPTKNAFAKSYGGGLFDGFVAKLNSTGALDFSTYLGGNNTDQGLYIAVDSNESIYVTGFTESSNFPIKNGFITHFEGATDVFITKFNSTGNVVYSSYLGGNKSDQVYGIGLDRYENCYISGYTYSSDFPTKNTYNETFNSTGSVFIVKLSSYPAYQPPNKKKSSPEMEQLTGLFMLVLCLVIVFISVKYRKTLKKYVRKSTFSKRNFTQIIFRKQSHPRNKLSPKTLEKIDQIIKEESLDDTK